MATNFQDLVAKVKNLVALAPVLGAISRPVMNVNYILLVSTLGNIENNMENMYADVRV